MLVTLTVQQPGDMLNWLLGWGARVRVLEPESLRRLIAREAQGVVANHAAHQVSTD